MQELYQLGRGQHESIRLNTQHVFIKDLNDGKLVHGSIPTGRIRSVADVATGTGVWLKDYASQIASEQHGSIEGYNFVGFDISPLQYPSQHDEVQFVIHDMTSPFPAQYHDMFDLVNIRLVVAAVPVRKLKDVLVNVLEILRKSISLTTDFTNSDFVCAL
jgi:SAM-dependent methyltransferase